MWATNSASARPDASARTLTPRVEKLAGDTNAWRIRIGDYRVIYEIHDRRLLIVILTTGHRRAVSKRK